MKKITPSSFRYIATAALLLYITSISAQTIGPLTLSSPGTTGTYSSNVRVTLAPGFRSLAPFVAKIQAVDCAPLTTSPTLTGNYVISGIPRISGFTDESQLAGQGTCQLMQSIQYVDGLGRPVQNVQVMASPALQDIILPQAYDQYGREINRYLPYPALTGASGSYRTNAVSTDQQGFYTAPPSWSGVSAIDSAHARTQFDNSPLNRPVEQGATGVPWQLTGITGGGHTVKMDYTSNNNVAYAAPDTSGNSRQVALYTTSIIPSGAQTLNRVGNNATYPTGRLTVTIAKDENWTSGRAGTVEEYKDIDGRVLLKRFYNYVGTTLQQLSTYYVYDDMGRLAFVLPPGAKPDSTSAISTATLNNFCYQYLYDGLGRPIQKKLPGKGWEYIVYNNMDQPVATQDSLQHFNKQWIYTKYDAQGRAVMTGIWTNGGADVTRTALQGTLTGITTNLYETALTTGTGYTNVAWPTRDTTLLTVNYYDNYSNAPGMPSQFIAPTGTDQGTRGQLVATKTAVLNAPADLLWSTHYYDYWGRSLISYAQHYLGGTVDARNFDAVNITYDFSNEPTTVTRKHWNTTSTTVPLLTITNTYLYDHVGRKLKTWEQIRNGSNAPTTKTLLSKIDYNEINQVKAKNLHSIDSVNFLQPINYTYNERGWLRSSSASLFQLQLQYNTGTNKQYNGNIAYQLWGTAALPNTNTFTYTYDRLNRLTSGASSDHFAERGISYDVMGNINTLSRVYNNVVIDSMAYAYSSTNQAQSINDRSLDAGTIGYPTGSHAYTYDGNGNVKIDNSKGISIGYNLLNLPQNITGGKTITYTYDAAGNKLRRVSSATGNTDYIGGIQYDGTATDTLSFIQTEEGKAVPNGAGYNYEYYLGDNLGNTRVTFGTKTGTVVPYQNNDYLPFGMEIDRSVTSPKNEYLYNKKELQEELGQYDYGARFYDPVIGRWTNVDPLAEIYRRWSTYNYVKDNPIRFTDPDGMSVSYDNWGNATYDNVGTPDATNYALGLQIAGQTSKEGKDKVRADAKAAADTSKSKGISLSSKVRNWTNGFALGTIAAGGGPEDVAADGIAGSEEILGQYFAFFAKLGEDVADLLAVTTTVVRNGNRKDNSDPHIVYVIFSLDMHGDMITEKYGISGRQDTDNGSNPRPAYQVNRLNKGLDNAEPGRLYSWVRIARTSNRLQALSLESVLVTAYARTHRGRSPNRQWYPLPK
ncbi:DUF6443 domain-containing protein [Mucilaginibacter xinganensis]|uniref:DUF6443 domain-containing protein n=1 Tax=Mucilaginibacter xinganensis TaxID=1234841 RepID=A0A223P3A7_9SPHI|nr:DUF6443 domain-containing protein [Mucilaginibacter xinganensis]ASU36338.1 hypothetical protein MuYL_4453 [Mucilaginibacter xinganensis]